tara:strand:- start:17681 stop:18844 length:1164 start_codon:yes stop_codon:yes gene_type:complete
MKKLAIIGQGFVGTAVREKFRKTNTVLTYDKYSTDLSNTYTAESELFEKNDLNKLIEQCNIVFLCVPTPMFEDGECNTTIVESVIKEISLICNSLGDKQVTVILKSTVPPGTTMKLNDISKLVTVAFSPEFLTEANSIEDFDKQDRIILGVDYVELVDLLRDVFISAFPDANIIYMYSKEAEMSKYITNLFLATKVSFFNDMYSVCESLEVDFNSSMSAVMLDPRIGKSHNQVPGPDGDRGYGGHCFPKDMSAILHLADKREIRVPTLVGADLTNRLNRTNKDWEKMEGRAVSKRDEFKLPAGTIGLENPVFYYNPSNPLQLSYEESTVPSDWTKVECSTFYKDELLAEPSDNQIIYRYTPELGYILSIELEQELEQETIVDLKFQD